MDKIRSRIKELSNEKSTCPTINADMLNDYGLEGITLRPYQIDGVQWLAKCYHQRHGCILADEMGLGKTCQTISFLVYLLGSGESSGPYLVLCPLSVLANWKSELERFAPSLKVLCYIGAKEERPALQKLMKRDNYNVVITTYEMCLKDEQFFRKYTWHTLVVDEAHRLKNRQSLLYQVLIQFDLTHTVLLTGTPVQNNLRELYALLSFVADRIFKDRYLDQFLEAFDMDSNPNTDLSSLHDILKPFLIRRIKSEVVKDLPKKSEVILYHGMSALQKKYYKAILTRDIGVFENASKTSKTQLMNILMQLRKCVDHPYLFDGVEPEPFVLGDHLIDASGKLVLLDQLLSYLAAKGHKVLLFSQMTRVLDIIQDYLGYRGYLYERLDGSVRGEERYLAVQSFNEQDDTFIFLLSTKAGGQGLNLVAADTVIFLDSDFNPQNDLQAAARAHRIGQKRAVKVIRLVGRCTVEEIILKRAIAKLKLTYDVIEGGHFSTATDKTALIADENFQLQDILKYGVDKLFENEESSIEDVDFEVMLGSSRDGEWVEDTVNQHSQIQSPIEAESLVDDMENNASSSNMYMFEGTDYSKGLSTEDKRAFDELIAAELGGIAESASEGRALRKHNSTLLGELPEISRRSRKPLTPDELEARKQKRAETLARRAKEAEEYERKKAEQKQKRKGQMWEKNHYTSLVVNLDSEGEESDQSDESDQNNDKSEEPDLNKDQSEEGDGGRIDLGYLVGDVTEPQNTGDKDVIVLHCVDDSGHWGRGGIFTALDNVSSIPRQRYEFAAEMKDICLGDLHLIPMDDVSREAKGTIYCGLMITQHRDRKNNLSGIKMDSLTEALQKVYKAAKSTNATVHLPRIGHNTPGFNWYGTERLLRKYLSCRGIQTYIYYYPRKQKLKRKSTNQDDSDDSDSRKVRKVDEDKRSSSRSPSRGTCQANHSLPSGSCDPSTSNNHYSRNPNDLADASGFLSGVVINFHKVDEKESEDLSRQVSAQGGEVRTNMSEHVTHIVVRSDLAEDQMDDLMVIFDEYRHIPIVNLSWLHDSLNKHQVLETGDYIFG